MDSLSERDRAKKDYGKAEYLIRKENKMQFICYSKCTTCQRAKKWLDEKNISYQERAIKTENPGYEELKDWLAVSGLPVKKFFNTSGLLYKSLQLKDKLPYMTDDEIYSILSSDGMLVKRPLIIMQNKILIGFKEKEWEENLL